ncbi:MAG: PH domain-containing protein [Haloferacaceae archaeon]
MKLSPLTVPYRILQRGASVAVAAAVALASGASAFVGVLGGLAVAAVLVGVAVLALVGYEIARYRRYDYELTADTFDIRSGVFARRNREIPLRRIQNVDIRRGVVQRLLGIAAVDFETAGGSETEAAIRYVSFEEATRLRDEIRRLKRGAAADDADAAEERELLFSLSDGDLLLVGAFAFDLRVPGVLLFLFSGLGSVLAPSLPDADGLAVLLGGFAVLAAVFVLVSWLGGAVAAMVNYYGFRLTRVGDELQYERGLFRRYDGSIPLDKVQTLTVTDDPLKRRFGYASLAVETAGYTPGQGQGQGQQSASLVPLAPRSRVFALANDVESFGTPAFERPPKRIRRRYAVRYLLALAAFVGVLYGVDAFVAAGIPWYVPLAAVPLVPLAAHLNWTHRGYWLGDSHVATRNGVLKRRTKVVPYYRIQTVIDSRTVFQRRWRVATVTADTAGSLSISGHDAAAVDVDGEAADRLREALSNRLREALAARAESGERGGTPPTGEAGDDG